MVYRLSFAQAFTVLATLALSSTQATAAIIRERQDAPAAPDISSITNDQPDTYHWDGFDQESEVEQYTDATKGLDLYYIREQALSIAKFDGSDEKDWYWFFAKTHIAQNPETGGPGAGCQVALYYDNIKKRYDLAKENNFATTEDSRWHVPSAMSPWCSEESTALDIVIKDDKYDEKLFGYKTIRPSTDPEHEALIVLLSELGFDKNSDTVNATKLDDKPSSEHVYGNPPLIGDPGKFMPAFKAAITEKRHNIVPNPYKYPKGDPIWAKKRQDVLDTLGNSATNGIDPAASSGPVTEVTATNTAETQTGVATAEVITTTDGAGLVVTTTLPATATDTGAVTIKPVTTIFGAPPADASQVIDDAQASGADVVDSTAITGTDTAAQATATREAVVDTASGSIATSAEPTATEVTIEASGTTITGTTTAAETQSLT